MRVRQQMLQLLSDGKPHPLAVLHELCRPSGIKQVRNNLCEIRKKLPPDEDIVCVLIGYQRNYQHVRLLPASVALPGPAVNGRS